MKIVTYNVNGIKQRISQHGSLLKLLNSLNADIICFQETKLSKEEITADLIMAEGYETFFSCTCSSARGRTGYSGVATFCRVNSAFSSKEVALPIAAEEGFTGLLEHSTRANSMKKDFLLQVSAKVDGLEEEGITKEEMLKVDSEGRCIITDHGHFVLFNLYGPRADPDDKERIHFKLTFFKILQKRWEALLNQGKRVIVVGDLNIAPAAIDRCDADPKFEQNQFRKWLRSLLVEQGGPFFDVFRSKHPERKEAYTCWSVHNGAEEFNFGSRIDHILIAGPCLHQNHDLQDHNFIDCHVHECDILTQFKRWKPENTSRWKGGRSIKLEGSDHVPVLASLREVPDLPEHNTPSLAARYVPKIHGFQQTIVTFLSKRQVAAKVKKPADSPLSDEKDTMGSCDNSFDRSLHYCSVSGAPSAGNLHTRNQGCEDTSRSLNEQLGTIADAAAEETTMVMLRSETTKSVRPCLMKTNKKARLGSSSQRTMLSYFQKKPSLIVDIDSANSHISHGEEDKEKGEDDSTLLTNELTSPKGTPVVSDENNNLQKNELDTSPSDLSQGDANTCSSSAKDKYNVAMSEWQRIQQLMHKHKILPLCKGHGEPCAARVVKKPGPTLGRKFYVCSRAEGPSSNPETNCGYFEWAASKSGKNRR